MLSCGEFLISETRLRDPIFDLNSKGCRCRLRKLLMISALREHNYLVHSPESFPLKSGRFVMPRYLHLSPIRLLRVFAILSFTFVVGVAVNADPITVTG